MGYSCEIDAQRRVVVVAFDGELTDAAMRAYYEAGRKLFAGMPAPAAMIYDLGAVTEFKLTIDAVRAFAGSAPHFADPVARFIVAPRDHVFGMARMFQSLGEESRKELYVVRSRKEAYQRLGVAQLALQPLAEG